MIVLPEPERLRWSGPSKRLEVTMKLYTRFELAARTTRELHVLIRILFNELAKSAPESAERRNALASLENVQAELACRFSRGLSGP
jgi:hypothetical protein